MVSASRSVEAARSTGALISTSTAKRRVERRSLAVAPCLASNSIPETARRTRLFLLGGEVLERFAIGEEIEIGAGRQCDDERHDEQREPRGEHVHEGLAHGVRARDEASD